MNSIADIRLRMHEAPILGMHLTGAVAINAFLYGIMRMASYSENYALALSAISMLVCLASPTPNSHESENRILRPKVFRQLVLSLTTVGIGIVVANLTLALIWNPGLASYIYDFRFNADFNILFTMLMTSITMVRLAFLNWCILYARYNMLIFLRIEGRRFFSSDRTRTALSRLLDETRTYAHGVNDGKAITYTAIIRTIMSLPPRSQTMIALQYFQNLPLNVVARRMRISRSLGKKTHDSVLAEIASILLSKQEKISSYLSDSTSA